MHVGNDDFISRKNGNHLVGFVDIMYGVVLGTGFSNFDKITSALGYGLFFFTYIITVMDWIVVHESLFERPYPNNRLRFSVDLAIVFIIYKLIVVSAVANVAHYWIWFSILFVLFAMWDIILLLEDRKNSRRRAWVLIHFLAASFYAIFGSLLNNHIIPRSLLVSLIPMLIYCWTVFLWYERFNPEKNAMALLADDT